MLVNCGPLNAAHSNEEKKFLSILYQFPQSQLWVLNNSASQLLFHQDYFALNTRRYTLYEPSYEEIMWMSMNTSGPESSFSLAVASFWSVPSISIRARWMSCTHQKGGHSTEFPTDDH